MKYFTAVLTPDGGGVHPVDRMLCSHPGIEREALLYVNAFNDGTGAMVYSLRGDRRTIADALSDHSGLLSYDIFYEDEREGMFHVHVHLRPGEPAGSLMMLFQKYALMVDTPIVFTEGGGLQTTLIGSHDLLRQAIDEMPESVSVSIRQVGQYASESRYIRSRLTARQLEVIETAIEMGYYEVPRRANHEDIATRLDCAASTVNEHLRKAEARVLSEISP
ncbi:MAG: helix-turn-helix domain-containing protein [Halalkalicoccus sp.]